MKIKIFIIFLTIILSSLFCGCIGQNGEEEEPKSSPINLSPNEYYTTSSGQTGTFQSSSATIYADAPEKGERRYILIQVNIWNPTNETISNLMGEISLPERWICKEIAGPKALYANTAEGDLEFWYYVETAPGPEFLGYDYNGDGFADIWNGEDNFDGVDCEEMKVKKIWSEGCTPDTYKLTVSVSGHGAEKVSLEYEVVLR